MRLPTQTYLVKDIQFTVFCKKSATCYTLEAFPHSSEEEEVPTYKILFTSLDKKVSLRLNEIVNLHEDHFVYNSKGFYLTNKNFKGCHSENIYESKSTKLPIDRVLRKGMTIYERHEVPYLFIKKYVRVKSLTTSKYMIVFFPDDKKEINIEVGDALCLDIRHLKKYKDIYIAEKKFQECLLLTEAKACDPSKSKEHRYLNLPSNPSYLLEWKNVIFQNCHIFFRSPYALKGGLGKMVKWMESRTDYEKIKIAFERIIPPISVKISHGNIMEINNLNEIKKRIINLRGTSSKPTKETIVHHRDKVQMISRPSKIGLARFKTFPEVKSSSYLKYLCDIHIKDYPIYYSTESKTTVTGVANPEKAFIFTIQTKESHITIVYENTIDSRSSYVFIIQRYALSKAIEAIHRFFISDEENKREKMANRDIEFPKYISNYYRIIHNTFHQWKVDINDFI